MNYHHTVDMVTIHKTLTPSRSINGFCIIAPGKRLPMLGIRKMAHQDAQKYRKDTLKQQCCAS